MILSNLRIYLLIHSLIYSFIFILLDALLGCNFHPTRYNNYILGFSLPQLLNLYLGFVI